MSDFPNPYVASEAPVVVAPPPLQPPGQIKVLGILHLVFGGFGLAMVLFSFAMQKLGKSIMDQAGAASGGDAQIEVQKAIMESGVLHQNLSLGASALLSVFLLVAGAGLLKRKMAGLTWSNVYAWLSIVSKIALGILFFVSVLPRATAALEGIGGGAKEVQTVISVAKISMIASGALTPLITCIYPILVLILLNRESVRKSLR